MSDVEKRVKKIIHEHLNIDEVWITPNADLQSDLGADSLDLVELVMVCEEEFGIEIPDDDAQKLNTIGEIVAWIDKKRA